MQETQNYTKYIIILGVVLLIIIVLVFIFRTVMNNNTRTNPPPIATITPQANTTVTLIPSTTILPTLPEGETRTGGMVKPLPPEEVILSDQKSALRDRLPVTQDGFTITMDYNDGKFLVVLTEPRAENRIKFDTWLSTNYSALPIDRFKFQ